MEFEKLRSWWGGFDEMPSIELSPYTIPKLSPHTKLEDTSCCEHKKFFDELDNEYKEFFNEFNGISELAEYIKKAKVSTSFNKERLGSERIKGSGYDDEDYNDFYNFDEAFNALVYGTDKYYKKFNYNFKKVNEYISKRNIHKGVIYKNDVIGFTPIVANYLKRIPINMINKDIKEKERKVATIIIEKAMTAGYKSKDMIKFSSIILGLVQVLEKKGIRCRIYISSSFIETDEVYAFKLKIKDFTQPLNLYKIQFPIISTDMFRRIGFRLLETCEYLKEESWRFTYGTTLVGEKEGYRLIEGIPEKKLCNLLKIKEDDIFIPNFTNFNYNSKENIEKTIDKIIKGTNFKKYIQLEEI